MPARTCSQDLGAGPWLTPCAVPHGPTHGRSHSGGARSAGSHHLPRYVCSPRSPLATTLTRSLRPPTPPAAGRPMLGSTTTRQAPAGHALQLQGSQEKGGARRFSIIPGACPPSLLCLQTMPLRAALLLLHHAQHAPPHSLETPVPCGKARLQHLQGCVAHCMCRVVHFIPWRAALLLHPARSVWAAGSAAAKNPCLSLCGSASATLVLVQMKWLRPMSSPTLTSRWQAGEQRCVGGPSTPAGLNQRG